MIKIYAASSAYTVQLGRATKKTREDSTMLYCTCTVLYWTVLYCIYMYMYNRELLIYQSMWRGIGNLKKKKKT